MFCSASSCMIIIVPVSISSFSMVSAKRQTGIGQCVGAHNQKVESELRLVLPFSNYTLQFFVNFLQWSTPWTLWIFSTLTGMVVKRSSDSTFSVDGQQIAIIVL